MAELMSVQANSPMAAPQFSQPVICICGPTASGKSALADEIALKLKTDVISVDAMQVYRGMDIGTAKTPVAERKVALQMVDVVDCANEFSVALYQRMARELVDERLSAGQAAVLCGGTGLYLDAIIDEMDFPKGEIKSETREHYEAILRDEGPQAVWEILAVKDPEGAEQIHPNNSKRVVRALEMIDEGKLYSEQHAGLKAHTPHYNALMFGLTMGRERLYERINQRVDLMFEDGLVDEVEALCGQGLEGALTSKQAIGYREILQYLHGEISLDEARELIKRDTRRYAKRQLSWLKRDGRVQWLDMDELDMTSAIEVVLSAFAAAGGKC